MSVQVHEGAVTAGGGKPSAIIIAKQAPNVWRVSVASSDVVGYGPTLGDALIKAASRSGLHWEYDAKVYEIVAPFLKALLEGEKNV